MLKNELSELNVYARDTFGHFLKWFSFFTGVNLIGYGWFSSLFFKLEENVSFWPIIGVATYFVINNVLAIFACNYVKSEISRSYDRMKEITSCINSAELSELQAQPSLPVKFYIKVIELIRGTFPTMILLWVLVAVLGFVYSA